MPKKYHRPFPKPSSTSPSYFSSSTATPATTDNGPKSVVDLLAHLRRSQTHSHSPSDVIPKPPPLTRTVPPSLQNILPDAAPPPPPLPRVRVGQSRRSWVAGPPPPASWLRKEPEQQGLEDGIRTEHRGPEDLYSLPGMTPIDDKALSHYALMSLAKKWPFHIVYDQYYLPELRPGLKSLLLAYVSIYSPGGTTISGLHALFPPPLPPHSSPEIKGEDEPWEDLEEEDITAEVHHLQLSYALSADLTFKDLTRLFTPPPTASAGVLESWDSLAIPRNRFPNLTHLSFASPSLSPSVLWSGLLQFTRCIPTITHLSLASWPILPHDPCGTMKRLARSLLCLKFLDISDCPEGLYTAMLEVEWDRAWRGVEEVVCRQREPKEKDEMEGWRRDRREAARVLGRKIREVRAASGGKWCRVVVE
ncbi:hypothetical protein RUND412_002632 [Rhizina undulata]